MTPDGPRVLTYLEDDAATPTTNPSPPGLGLPPTLESSKQP